MNIFYLDPDPKIAASYHCDQHLGKMILESAQMLSPALINIYNVHPSQVYKPTHINHPCTQLLMAHRGACLWVINLCEELDSIRESLDRPPHESSRIIKLARDYMYDPCLTCEPWEPIFCGPDYLKLPSLSVPAKYRLLYIDKFKEWKFIGKLPMSYKSRPLPYFLSNHSKDIRHES